jgi:hypothetical protein
MHAPGSLRTAAYRFCREGQTSHQPEKAQDFSDKLMRK